MTSRSSRAAVPPELHELAKIVWAIELYRRKRPPASASVRSHLQAAHDHVSIALFELKDSVQNLSRTPKE